MVSVHMQWGTCSTISSRRKAPKMAPRLAAQEGQKPRREQEKARRYSLWQAS
jgi:hypothetical protein